MLEVETIITISSMLFVIHFLTHNLQNQIVLSLLLSLFPAPSHSPHLLIPREHALITTFHPPLFSAGSFFFVQNSDEAASSMLPHFRAALSLKSAQPFFPFYSSHSQIYFSPLIYFANSYYMLCKGEWDATQYSNKLYHKLKLSAPSANTFWFKSIIEHCGPALLWDFAAELSSKRGESGRVCAEICGERRTSLACTERKGCYKSQVRIPF